MSVTIGVSSIGVPGFVLKMLKCIKKVTKKICLDKRAGF